MMMLWFAPWLSCVVGCLVAGTHHNSPQLNKHHAISYPRAIMERTAIQLYRDCLRLAHHIGGNSVKGKTLKAMVRTEFVKGSQETNPEKIDVLKGNAIRGLSNYMLMANAAKDPRFNQSVPDAEFDEKNTNWGQAYHGICSHKLFPRTIFVFGTIKPKKKKTIYISWQSFVLIFFFQEVKENFYSHPQQMQ